VYFFVGSRDLKSSWPRSETLCAMINDGVSRRSRPERELNYKQTHTHRIYLLISLSPLNTCVDGWTTGRIYAYYRAGRSFAHCIIYVTFPFRLFQRAYLPPPLPPFYQSLSTRGTVTASHHWSAAREESSHFVSTVLQWLHRLHTLATRRASRGQNIFSGSVGHNSPRHRRFVCNTSSEYIYPISYTTFLCITTIRLYPPYCPFVRLVYAHMYYILYIHK
jgi:hypothetical protein